MIAPATVQVAKDFGITNNVLIAMTTSIFILGYGKVFLLFVSFQTDPHTCIVMNSHWAPGV